MMKRAEITGKASPFSIAALPIPDPPPKGVVVKTQYSGVCHTDIHIQDGYLDMGDGNVLDLLKSRGLNYPLVPGHEVAGLVHSIGKEVPETSGLKVGDRVMVYPWFGCRNCPVCKSGETTLCKDRSGRSIGQGEPGGFSTHVSVPEAEFVVPVPDNVPMDLACMAPCSGVTAYNALMNVKGNIERMNKIKGKANLLVVGAGGLGVWCIQLAKCVLPAATRVIVADITEAKLKFALEAGADDVVCLNVKDKEGNERKMQEKFGAEGLEAVIDFVNNDMTVPLALDMLNHGGTASLVGLFGGMLKRPLPLIVGKIHTIVGTIVGSLRHLREIVSLMEESKFQHIARSHYKLEDIEDVITKLRKGEIVGRAILTFPDK